MADNCFCHLNGLAVKDATARKEIENINDKLSKMQTTTGKSAYEYALEGGYNGTEEEFSKEINPDRLRTSILESVLDIFGGKPVFGVITENNIIHLSSVLLDGTYTIVYENEDGVTSDKIAEFIVGTGAGEGSGGELPPPDTTITWSYTTKIGSDGTETTDNNYGASNHIQIVDGYTYTLTRPSTNNKATGIKVCYYDVSKTYISTSSEICSASAKEETVTIPMIEGARYFKLRVNSGNGGTATYLDGITVTATKE